MNLNPAQLMAWRQRKAQQAAAFRARAGMASAVGSTRRPSPFPEAARARLEEVVQPQYDTEGITALSGETLFFARPVGQVGIGGHTKTIRDTNMRTASSLPRPQVFVVTGIRVVPSLISGDAAASPAASNPDFSDYKSTFLAIMWETVSVFRIGTKEYLTIPTFRLPGNIGVEAMGWAQRTATAAEAAENDVYHSIYGEGEYFSTMPGRLRLPSLQGFGFTLQFPRAALNSTLVSGGLKVTVFLDGIHGREVQ